ncbi:MAG: cupin domain-containing protein [Pseudomonadota bacterium]
MLNMQFENKIDIDTNNMDWVSSPSQGVWRKPLAREEAERGHATAIVKFDPGVSFSPHDHPLGEEILVLEGTFSDENGDYPAGTYIRNPEGYRHEPFSRDGCTIFVKLHQFSEGDDQAVRINIHEAPWLPGHGNLQVMPLHSFEHEHTAMVKWPANEKFQPHRHFGGEEILVLSGTFRDEFGSYSARHWIRSPHMSQHNPFVEEETIIWVKTGHLPITAQ